MNKYHNIIFHFAGFAVITFLLFVSEVQVFGVILNAVHKALFMIFMGGVIEAVDLTLSKGRYLSDSIIDLILDCIGIIAGIFLAAVYYFFR